MIIPKQSIGSIRTTIPISAYINNDKAGVNAQQFLGCKTSPCINGKQYRVCITRKTICTEIPGFEEFGIPSEVICFPGDYDVRVQKLNCGFQKIPVPPIVMEKSECCKSINGSDCVEAPANDCGTNKTVEIDGEKVNLKDYPIRIARP